MAKHKKAKKAAKEEKPQHKEVSHKICRVCNKKSLTWWVVGGIVLLIVILLIFFYGKKPAVPEEPVIPAEEPVQEAVDEQEGMLVPSEVEVIEQSITHRDTYMPFRTTEGESMFGGIKCLKSTGYKKDVLEFQFKNKEADTLYIRFVNPKNEPDLKAARLSINGADDIRQQALTACGTEKVEPGQAVNCKIEIPLRHFGPTGKKSANILQVKTPNFASRLSFYC